MIRPLRSRHRRTVTALALLLPAALALAIGARPPEPRSALWLVDGLTEAELPLAPGEPAPFERVYVRDLGPFAGLPFEADLGFGTQGEVLLELRPTGPVLAPDLLVYWLPGGAAPDVERAEVDLAKARLLGRAAERRRWFRLPDGGGRLLLFDPARGELVAEQALPELVE